MEITETERHEYRLNPSLKFSFSYEARRKSMPRIRLDLEPSSPLMRLLAEIFASPDPAAAILGYPRPIQELLADVGILVRAEQAPDEVSYDLGIAPDVLEWIPEPLIRRAGALAGRNLRLNPSFSMEEYSRPPITDGFGAKDAFPPFPAAWITDPGTGMAWPFVFDEALRSSIREIQRGSLAPEDLDPELRRVLILAEILVAEGFAERRQAEWARRLEQIARDLEVRQYATLKDIVNPFHAGRIRQYYRKLEKEGYLGLDPHNAKRYLERNEAVASFLHRQAGHMVRKATNDPVFPAFCYVSPYLEGADLPRHVDNAQCRWNGSLLIDMMPETPVEESWPIFLGAPGGPGRVQLGLGDCVLYRGSEVPHWREALPGDRRQTLLLFHYVAIDFTEDLLGPTRYGSGAGLGGGASRPG